MTKTLSGRCAIRLILVRHGETAWNQERRIQGGSSDVELSELGRKQVERLGLALKETKIDAIYSSPLKRALDTATAIASHHQLTVQVEPDLREMEVGELEGVSIADTGINFSQFLLQWRQGQGLEKLPGGESVADLADRLWATIQSINKKHRQETVVVVSHYFAVVATICKALGWPLTRLERIRLQTSSISIIDLEDGQP
ncbi:MAG: histidine phosphatase family protein, partial [Chloroflexi bacterium]|nr:histidine phosphatase family protein [Chloroflexota bacterium]